MSGVKRARSTAFVAAPAIEPHELQVFVSGIPYTVTEADVRAFFTKCGDITIVNAPTYQDTGRLRGIAHISFAERAGVSAALALDGTYMGTRFLTIEPAKPAGSARPGAAVGRAPKGSTTLFARNLPYDADEDSVRAGFAKFGAIASVRIPRRSDTGAPKGFGYVQFEHAFSAEAAVKAAAERTLTIGGRALTVDWDTAAPKASFKGADGRAFAKTEEASHVKAPTGAGVPIKKPRRGPTL